jgi:UDP-glucuronate 4-epimerase
MRILVTGAAGFIGSWVAQRLLARGDEVIGLDNFNHFYDPCIKHANVRAIESSEGGDRFRMISADISTEDPSLEEIFTDPSTKPDVVCHLAAWAGVRPSIAHPQRYIKANILGLTRLLDLAVAHQVKPFVFASSSSVYGARKEVPFRETDAVDDPVSPYAATKKAGELIGYTYHHLYQLGFIGLRFFTVYGPRQRPEMAIHLFADKIGREEAITLFGDGSSSRDYTYIDDIVDGVVASVDLSLKGPCYEIINLGGSETTSLSELVQIIETAVGKKAIIERLPDQPGDVPRTFADVSKAREKLNYQPKVDVKEGIDRFVDWLNKKAPSL